MITTCKKFGKGFDKNFLAGKRFVYFADESKEKAPPTAVPETEKIDARKKQARQEIDGIYELGKYDTYNFRKLPADFKSHMKDNFGQWVDSQIAKYDEDKNSGIDAKEYAKFKEKLQEKVESVLDRLIELKQEKKKEAEAEKKGAENAKEAQKRLEGVDVTKLDQGNLESADGIYTELLKYQKDFENEAQQFGSMGAVFADTKEKMDGANKSHTTGATALGEYLVSLAPWTDDIPEVADAKKAKEKAVADFRAKLAEMKKRQKDRQARGASLNGAPEKVKAKRQKEYEEARAKVKKAREDLKKKRDENEKKKNLYLAKVLEMEETRKKLQQKYDETMSRIYAAQKKKKPVADKKAEMDQAAAGLAAVQGAAPTGAPAGGEGPAATVPEGQGGGEGGGISTEAERARARAVEASKGMGAGLQMADTEIAGMGSTAAGLQRQLTSVLESKGSAQKQATSCDGLETKFAEADKGMGESMDKMDKAEKQEMEQIDGLDEAIASTVLEVDTANFELIKKGEDYLKQLSSMEAKGPGIFDTAGAMLKGIPGAEKAGNWIGKKLDGAWAWAKKAPVIGAGIEIAGYMGEGWVKSWDWIGKQFTDFADWAHLPDAWDWMGEASKHLNKHKATGNPGYDTIMDMVSGGAGGTLIEVFAGVTLGCKGLVQGIGMIAQHPFETIKGLGQLVNHPSVIVDAFLQKDKWGEESASKIIGRMMVDVVTTLTGAGATAQGVKVSVAAMKIGGIGVGRAAYLGARTFVEVFVKDIGGLVVGVVKLPVTILKGGGKLLVRVANGGKAAEVIEAAGIAGKKVTTAREAYEAVEATRGKPKQFETLLREHPEYLDVHAKYTRDLAAAEKKAATVKKKPDATEKPKPPDKTKPTPKQEPELQISAKEAVVGAEEATKPASGRRSVEAAKEKAVVAEEMVPKPDFSPKPKTHERAKLYEGIEAATVEHPALQAAAKSFGSREFLRLMETLPTEELRFLGASLDKLDATLVQRILKQDYSFTMSSKGKKIRYYVGETLGEGGFGIVSDCAYMVEGGQRLEIAAIKRPKNTEAMRLEIQQINDMITKKKPTEAEFVRLGERIAELRQKLQTTELKPDERLKLAGELRIVEEVVNTGKITEEYVAKLRARLADYNFQLNSIERIFANERFAMQAVLEFGDTPGLLKPRIVSRPGMPDVIIYDRVEPLAGKKITLKERLYKERPEDILQYFYESLQGLDTVHEHGWVHMDFKPENIFVGKAGKGEQAFLGDLALVSVEELSQLRLIEAHSKKGEKSKSYAVVRMGPSGSIADSRQIGITPSYFSPDHINALIEYAKKAASDARAHGLDPSKIKIPKDVLALADKNQVGVSLERYMKVLQGTGDSGRIIPGKKTTMAKTWHIPESAIDDVIAELAHYSSELKNANSGVTVPEVMVALEAARAKLMRAGAPGGELPKAISI